MKKLITRTVEMLPPLSKTMTNKINDETRIATEVASNVFGCIAKFIPEIAMEYRNVINNGRDFGYYITQNPASLIDLILRLKARSILDLGCGAGILLAVIKKFLDNNGKYLKYGGIELNPMLCHMARHIVYDSNIKCKDLMYISEEDIEAYDILFMWEPIRDHNKASFFVDNLVSITHPNQTIVLYPSGSIQTHLNNHKQIKSISNNNNQFKMFHKI